AADAVWVFADEVSNSTARTQLVSRSAASGVNTLYVSVYSSTPNGAGRLMFDDTAIADLIQRAHVAGIEVWAAYGAPDWPQLGCALGAFPLQRMQEVIDFNAAKPTTTLDGVMLDVESSEGLDSSSRQALLALYECSLDMLKPAGVGMQTAIRFFWDETVEYPLTTRISQKVYEHVLDMDLHKVVVMGYRDFAGSGCPDDGIICLDQDEVVYAGAQGKPGVVLAGAETGVCDAECGGDGVTFLQEGQAVLNREAACVAEHFAGDPGFGGFAIHRYDDTYLSGSAAWPATNPDFPGSCHAVWVPTTTYQLSDDLFPNPERGFLYAKETHSGNNYAPLDETMLRTYRQDQGITLIKRYFYLDDFVSAPISQTYLDLMQADFDSLRRAGLKAVVRFAYANSKMTPTYGDADKLHILAHLTQLKPIIEANQDVIAVVEAGFIGNWGEWFYTDNFVADPYNPGEITDEDYANRWEVLEKILNVLPPERSVQLRTPFYKYKVFDTLAGWPATPLALPAADAHNGSDLARTGHHNDCFLGSDTDAGTFGALVPIAEDKNYLAAETQYVPMGGEVCDPDPDAVQSQIRFSCTDALAELERFHWSYLNVETGNYGLEVYNGWNEAGCLAEIQRRLGYRLTLTQGTYPDEVIRGNEMTVHIELQNVGWASPLNPRPVQLVLRHKLGGVIYTEPLPTDPRFWLADNAATYSIDHTFLTDPTMPVGVYELLLNLPDPEPILAGRPDYAIRLANQGVWEADTGYNNLRHTVIMSNGSSDVVPPTVSQVDTVADTGDGVLGEGETTGAAINQLRVIYSEDVRNTGATDAESVINPANYRLFGANLGAIGIDSVAYDGGNHTAILTLNDGNPLPEDSYIFTVVGNAIEDLVGNKLDGDGNGIGGDDFVLHFAVVNWSPDCSAAVPSVAAIWPVNHKFVAVNVLGVTDPQSDPLTITITGIWQDEPVDTDGDGKHMPDGQGIGTSTAQVRAERTGGGNGRLYHIDFVADDGNGGSCAGEVQVGVPHDKKDTPVDDGRLYDSTLVP
ncbi:MAG: DUF4832 domain-containing protein, partial [Caldilineaceae bacterium]|nr:DUF4832 domain-containing protein [Caldilineaceae bacterium]